MMKQSSSEAVLSSSAVDKSHSSISWEKPLSSSRDGSGGAQEIMAVDRPGEYTAKCRWTVESFPCRLKSKALWSKYFDVGGYDCRLLVYPKGDSQALPGYISIYLQIIDPRGTTSSLWDCFASYRLSIVNHVDDSLTIHKESWHRFSSKKRSHGWCDFTLNSSILDPKIGFLFNNDSLLITADILILNESLSFSIENNNELDSIAGPMPDVLSGNFSWRVNNFSLFKEMMKSQKITSPIFVAGECYLRIGVYQSVVNEQEYLSMCLDSSDTEKTVLSDKSSWCLFSMSALNQKPGCTHMNRESYGRFAADNRSGDNTSVGWNDYMKMSDFVNPKAGFLVDDAAVFSTSFHVIKEFNSLTRTGGLIGGRNGTRNGQIGKFTWTIENFTRLVDLLEKRKVTGLCIKSKRFQIGNRDCRLIVYPRGQSQPPCHLSVFLEVTDSRSSSDWSCFVSHRLSVVNQRLEEKSVTKESQNRYSKAAKDWGWREFVTLTSLFDQDSGFLVQDTVVFSAEVLILKETSATKEYVEAESANSVSPADNSVKRSSFTWKVENFLAFKEIMETRKIFSKFFQAGGCELRIGVYESFDTICIYLESDQSAGTDVDNNFWVKYKMGILNQKNPAKSVWKESSICTKTWNNSVLQFMKVSDMLEADAGFLVRDTVVFVCEILDCCPWFEFSDLEVLASDDDQDALTTDPDEIIDSEESEGISGDEEDTFRDFLSQAGFHLTFGENPSQPQVTLREKLLMDAGAIAGFLTGLRVYLDDPTKVKRLLLPTKISCNDRSKLTKSDESSPSLMNLLMGVKVLQQAIIDLLLDIMVECCQPSEEGSPSEPSLLSPKTDGCVAATSSESIREKGAAEPSQHLVDERFKSDTDATLSTSAVPSSDMNGIDMLEKALAIQPISPPNTSAGQSSDTSVQSKTKWPEQSEELLGLIVNSLKTLDAAVPQGCPEPRRRPHSAQKIALVLDRAPKHLQPDLVSLVPKLVEHSEHPLAALALIERLQKPEAEPALREPVYNALSQLECDSEVWEHILFQSFELLSDSNEESLVAAIHFTFKTASQCQHLPEAVNAVRERLKSLGADVSLCVLDYMSKTVHSWPDIAEMILRDINTDNSLGGNFTTLPCGPFLIGENETASEMADLMDEHEFYANRQFFDVYILLEMLSISCLAEEASQTFERAVARGAIVAQAVAMVLEKQRVQGPNLNATSGDASFKHQDPVLEGEASEQPATGGTEFRTILNLAETLTHSRDPQVRGFVKMLYTILFKWFPDQPFRVQILRRLVDRFTSPTSSGHDLDLELEILAILIFQEQEVARPVLAMLKKVVEHANIDRAALWHQLRANKEELVRLKEEKKTEIQSMTKEKSSITQKLSESEAANTRLKSEMKAEMDRFTREKKDLVEQFRDVESQLEWIRSERQDEIDKLSSEKKTLLDRLHEAETQLALLKTRKRDELKKVGKEKNALTEKLKITEAARKRFEEELKRYATENVTREELRKSLEDQIRQLTQTVGQTKEEKREKEDQISRCEAYIDGMETKLQACQQYIHTLESSLREEISRHAPLYGANLESLSMKELDTIALIHEEGLRQIHALQQRKGHNLSHGLPQGHTLYPTTPPQLPPMAIGLPPQLIPNGSGVHSNGHINGSVRPWFSHHT
ncbi:MATH/TRAF domain [Arabidopsis thaliana x Arabidopsis arenosa]|uniref:MATH/TRAF domain n=1 Tax=Arabidopsis thaliana x Arabidopsis arenosa TaxID=1240361 RepID=A0A8T2A2E0_9BRAS|nr:MATH/TRAF domain [Arabidopsis thaliana x Arabidopsis arenosa]